MLINLVQFSFRYVLYNVLVNVSRSLEYTLSLVWKIETGCCVNVESYKMLIKSLRLLHISIRKGYFLRKKRMGGICKWYFYWGKGGCSCLCKGWKAWRCGVLNTKFFTFWFYCCKYPFSKELSKENTYIYLFPEEKTKWCGGFRCLGFPDQ